MEVSVIGVVGSGQMGRGIAQVSAMSGYKTLIFDISAEALNKAMGFIKKQLDRGVEKGKWDQKFVDAALSNIETVEDLSKFSACQMAIEAATENKNIKIDIFKKLDGIVSDKCILASNTSSISITMLAGQCSHPERFVGMHFMNPVPVMKLVEGIRGLETSDEVFTATQNVAQKMGKTFVKAKDYPGFAVNRILMPMINEAIYALYEGVASIEDIDSAMTLGTNQPMGPLTLADFIGLDTCLAIMEVLHDGLGDSKYRPCPLLKQYVDAGRMGRKVGKGFYTYSND